MNRPLPISALLILALATPLAATAGERIRYACAGDTRIDVSFSADADGRPQATLHLADGDLILPGVPAASGALYRAPAARLHTKGDDAVFEDARGSVRRCTRADALAAETPAASGSLVEVTGTVATRQRSALPPDTVLIVRIQDVSRADARALVLAEQRIELNGRQVPIPFAMNVDRDLVGKRARITVAARIERAGKLLFISDTAYPAIVDGQPRHVDMTLKQVAAPPTR